MNTIEKTIEYHELIMTLNSFSEIEDYALPKGYKFVFWERDSDIESWIDIHLNSGEFASLSEAREIFMSFMINFIKNYLRDVFLSQTRAVTKLLRRQFLRQMNSDTDALLIGLPFTEIIKEGNFQSRCCRVP